MAKPKCLTLKQKKFCDEYIITGNATQSAIAAGYSKSTAYAMGAENLKKPQIVAYIDERIQQIESDKIAEASEVLQYLTSVLRGEAQGEEIMAVGIGEGCSEVVNVKKYPSEQTRVKAAELLGKRYRLFTDKLEVEGAVPVVISGEDELED